MREIYVYYIYIRIRIYLSLSIYIYIYTYIYRYIHMYALPHPPILLDLPPDVLLQGPLQSPDLCRDYYD